LRLEQPLIPDAWARLKRSLELMNSFRAAKVVRLTLVKGHNDHNVEGYAGLVDKTDCDYLEVKGFTWVGEAQRRLPREATPTMEEVRSLAQRLSALTGYGVKDEFVPSRVVLLSKG
ncbi:MAG: 4-demethylwyosine synthase TYW1, partial [Candidatus Bathyarchaeia archaeon]